MKKKISKEENQRNLQIYHKQKFALLDAIELIKSTTMKYHLERFKSIDHNRVSYVEIYDEIALDINNKNSVINGLKNILSCVEIDINFCKKNIEREE